MNFFRSCKTICVQYFTVMKINKFLKRQGLPLRKKFFKTEPWWHKLVRYVQPFSEFYFIFFKKREGQTRAASVQECFIKPSTHSAEERDGRPQIRSCWKLLHQHSEPETQQKKNTFVYGGSIFHLLNCFSLHSMFLKPFFFWWWRT